MNSRGTLKYLVGGLQQSSKNSVSESQLWYAIRGALNPKLLLSNLAEALRIPSADTETLLIESGFGDLVARGKLDAGGVASSAEDQALYQIAEKDQPSPFPELLSIKFSPAVSQPIQVSEPVRRGAGLLVKTLLETADDDAFAALYRKDVWAYHESFLASDAVLIDRYIADQFRGGYPRYVVNSGIGANEQFNHLLSRLNNLNPARRVTWLITDSPRHLTALPTDANVENTLFMEFSRSGKTEETVKVHEFTTRAAKRIVFANSGPLREIGLRDNNLVLDLPDEVSGRFGRNKTPILLAPMYVAGMDTGRFWRKIEEAIAAFGLSSPNSLPVLVSQFIYLYQQRNGINHIYFGCNDDLLACSVNELLQFWNEGVNKESNDISMSAYFGLLRDSHATIEGILGNHKTKMGIFLLRDELRAAPLPPMTTDEIDAINPEHAGLRFGDDEIIMAEANVQRFSELMPVITISAAGRELTIEHAAVLGQLWADITFCYSKLANVDPGSNPEVKFVRDRSAELLGERARALRSNVT